MAVEIQQVSQLSNELRALHVAIPMVCLLAALVAGLFGKIIGRTAAHRVTIAGVGLAFLMPPNPTMVYPSWLNHHPRKELIRFENLFLRENI